MARKSKIKQKDYIILFLALALVLSFVLILKSTDNNLIKNYASPTPTIPSPSFTTTEMNNGKEEKFTYKVADLMKNTEITVPGTNTIVTLKNGQATYSENGSEGTIMIGDIYAVVPTGENDFDIFAEAIVNSGGSGEFVYVVLYHATTQLFENTDSLSIGDRVKVTNISPLAKNTNSTSYLLGIDYLDRRIDQPMSDEPTVKNIIKTQVKDHKFVEN